jgi:hypothetical protein
MVSRAPVADRAITPRNATAPVVNFLAFDSAGNLAEFSTADVAWIHR